jgi:hypothetical protein
VSLGIASDEARLACGHLAGAMGPLRHLAHCYCSTTSDQPRRDCHQLAGFCMTFNSLVRPVGGGDCFNHVVGVVGATRCRVGPDSSGLERSHYIHSWLCGNMYTPYKQARCTALLIPRTLTSVAAAAGARGAEADGATPDERAYRCPGTCSVFPLLRPPPLFSTEPTASSGVGEAWSTAAGMMAVVEWRRW